MMYRSFVSMNDRVFCKLNDVLVQSLSVTTMCLMPRIRCRSSDSNGVSPMSFATQDHENRRIHHGDSCGDSSNQSISESIPPSQGGVACENLSGVAKICYNDEAAPPASAPKGLRDH